jgi:hypothetical protein
MQLQISLNSGQPKQVNAERLVNIYAEESGGKSPVALTGVPGLSLFANLNDKPVRGMSEHNGALYVVTDRLWQVSSNGSATDLGLIVGSGVVQMESNGLQLCIVGSTSYVWDGTLHVINDPDFPGADSVAYLDGYFIFSNGTGQFFISALYDGTDFDALDFASAESNPDPIVRVFVDHREVMLFGTETVEIWANTGGSDFPFERIPGAISEKGLAGRNAIAKLDNSVVWIDQTGIVRRMAEGYSPVRISTHDIERSLAEGEISQAECFAYSREGHEFFVITVPDSGTFVFDAATNLWHERQTFGDTRWRARGHVRLYGQDFVGDYQTGKVYRLDPLRFDENGDLQVAEMIFPPIHAETDRFRAHRVVLDMEHGETPPHGESVVRLDLSNDSQDWTTVGYGSMGKTGQRVTRTVWRRLGQHRNLHLRFRISDPVRRTVYAGFAEMERDE